MIAVIKSQVGGCELFRQEGRLDTLPIAAIRGGGLTEWEGSVSQNSALFKTGDWPSLEVSAANYLDILF